uniref:FH2 domain-containing protein n=1 Tax=Gongylonema pulchrum TaxID=637853 RepID=A0A183D8F2_9BILA
LAIEPSDRKLDKNSAKNSGSTMSPKSVEKQGPKETPAAQVPAPPAARVPAPPPPPPPPAPEFLNPSLMRNRKSADSPVVVNSVAVYKKKCATSTVFWEAIKPEAVVTKATIWSDQSGTNAEFKQSERERVSRTALIFWHKCIFSLHENY